jgi:hypothetical protein
VRTNPDLLDFACALFLVVMAVSLAIGAASAAMWMFLKLIGACG